METPSFLTVEQARRVRDEFGTPVFVYDQATLERRAGEVLAFPNAYGLTARYAMKALPTAAVVRVFDALGLHIDASSGFEAVRALRAGVAPPRIQITVQEIPANLADLVRRGVRYNACSIHQIAAYGRLFPNTEVSLRVNPGLGSGSTSRTNVGGPASSFGIWHEHLDGALDAAAAHGLRVTGMHTHIGSGSDPEVWVRCAKMSLGIAARMPEVARLSLGGGYKVARMPHEKTTDLQDIGARIVPEFEAFAECHGRRLHLEIEPGTYLTANAGALVSSVIDLVDTGSEGYRFIKIDAGMTEIARSAMYGAEHPIIVVPAQEEVRGSREYLVSGHCCESGDTMTPQPGDPEGLRPRMLTEACVGDLAVIEGAGAYCAAQSCKNYNSFPEAAEVLLRDDGEFQLVRARQTIEQITQNEVL